MSVDYVGGCDESKEKINLYKLKSKLLQNKFYFSFNKEYDIFKDLKHSIKKLKEIDTIFARSDVESNVYKSTSYPAFLWQREIVNRYNFFGVIIGVIDGNIDETKRSIEWHKKFNDKERLKVVENKKAELEAKRNVILCDLKNSLTISDPNILFDTLCTLPSYKYFTNCYENVLIDEYNCNLQIELVNSYNKGYINSSKFYTNFAFTTLIDYYKSLLNELKEHKEKNKTYVKKLTNKYQK